MSANETTNADPRSEPPVELTPVQARQGVLGRPVLAVLVIGLVLAMLVWAVVEIWGMSIAPRGAADDPPTAAPSIESTTPNGDIINDDPPVDEKRQTEPVLIDPKPTGNQ